jgi:hypothetical protein
LQVVSLRVSDVAVLLEEEPVQQHVDAEQALGGERDAVGGELGQITFTPD